MSDKPSLRTKGVCGNMSKYLWIIPFSIAIIWILLATFIPLYAVGFSVIAALFLFVTFICVARDS